MEEAKKRFDELDGLKIFFALWIILYHYWGNEGGCNINNCPKLSEFIYIYGWLGVEFFFILSGFLMEHTYRNIIDNLSFPQFIGRRLKSIYVPYLCSEFLAIFVTSANYILCQGRYLFYPAQRISISNILKAFSMTSYGWNSEQYPFMGSSWYINVLLICYVA